mmetsp:Transcript_17083/g.16305  ORF Transcript_17083/g.16305 Transcript_17083/m.16305 type:complete len:94 (+) Transcript_17083:449-730(+)
MKFTEMVEEKFPTLGILSYKFGNDFKNIIFQNINVDLRMVFKSFYGIHFEKYLEGVQSILTQWQLHQTVHEEDAQDEQTVQFEILKNIEHYYA